MIRNFYPGTRSVARGKSFAKIGIMQYPCILLITISLFAWSQAKELYSDKYDYVNIDEVLANERLRDQYLNCLMETAPCLTPDAVFFKGKFL